MDICIDYGSSDCLEALIDYALKHVPATNMQPMMDVLPNVCRLYPSLAINLLRGLDKRFV